MSEAYETMTLDRMHAKMQTGWTMGRSVCGKGSDSEAVAPMIGWFPDFVERYGIVTCADVGAGDLAWFPKDAVDVYNPYDLIPRHPSVTQLDCVTATLPPHDVIVCRYVLNHISANFARRALERFTNSGSKYLLISMFDKNEQYWREHDMYPLPGLVETFPDHDGRKNKRMELHALQDN